MARHHISRTAIAARLLAHHLDVPGVTPHEVAEAADRLGTLHELPHIARRTTGVPLKTDQPDYLFGGIPNLPSPSPSKHERKEHAGRVPQVGVPSGPRQTVAPTPGSPAAEAGLPVAPSHGTPPSRVRSYAPDPSSPTYPQELIDLITPGPTAREIADSALRLGVKPKGIVDQVGDAVDTVAQDFSGLAKAAGQEAEKVARLPKELPKQRVDNVLGTKTLGNPTLGQVAGAAVRGQLGRNRRGRVTVPETRQAARNLKATRQAYAATARPDTTGLSPEEKAVIPYVLKAHKKYPDVPVSVLMAQIKQESGFNPEADSGVAKGLSQFIESTANEYGVKYGAGKREQQSQVTGEAHYLHNLGFKSDPQAALSSYSGGYAAGDYNNPILSDAQASYSRLDRPTVVPPQVRQQLATAKARAQQLGIPVKSPEQIVASHPAQLASIPGKGRYVFPFPENKGWVWSRTDMGTDFGYGANAGAPIRALGSGTIVQTGAPGWPGEGGILLKLDHAQGLPSPYIFVYEGIEPTVQAGDRVAKGQLVGKGGITGSIEIGFADSSGQALAHNIYTEGMVTPQGQAMTNFLHAIEQGRTKVPVSLLQVGGNVFPSGGGVSVSGSEEAVVGPSVTGAAPASPKQQQAPVYSGSRSAVSPLLATGAPLPAAFQQFQQGVAPEEGTEDLGGLIDAILKRRRV